MNSAICYLLINKIPKLPKLAIESALQNTQAEIYIGYLNNSDLSDLPKSERIHYIDLSVQAFQKNLVPETGDYVSFDKDFFFQLVQLKWDLFHLVFTKTNIDILVYLDLDVVVLKDVVAEFENTFKSLPHINVLVQDFTHEPSIPRLCMGVFALRRGHFSTKLLQLCSDTHQKTLFLNPRFGDDDVITAVYADKEFKNSFLRLPQQSFPVGNLVNLFLPISPLRGLRPLKPFIFHANFVVGFEKKHLLLRLVFQARTFAGFVNILCGYFIILNNFAIHKFRRFAKLSLGKIREY